MASFSFHLIRFGLLTSLILLMMFIVCVSVQCTVQCTTFIHSSLPISISIESDLNASRLQTNLTRIFPSSSSYRSIYLSFVAEINIRNELNVGYESNHVFVQKQGVCVCAFINQIEWIELYPIRTLMTMF